MAYSSDHLFKFIPPGFKFKLPIPKSFLWKLDGWRCKKATLRRGRHKWAVHIGDGGVFSDGWRKFVVENGVQELDFIVFKHQGNMEFDFFVFDQSTCEREYPNLLDDVEVSHTESDSLYTHKRSKMLNKRKRSDYASQSKDELRFDNDRCFVTIMTPEHIRAARLNVPMKFARSNGLTTKGICTQVVLVDEAKRTWPAKLRIKTYQICLMGWRKLIIKIGLKVGDTCMFKLVKDGVVPVFKFYNLGMKPNNHHMQVKKEASSTIKMSTRYFISTMKPDSCKRSRLYVPRKFLISNDLRMGEMILRDNKGRSWKVLLNKSGKDQFYLGCGFSDFWDANGLTEGVAYKFELVENDKDMPPIVNFSLNVDSAPSEREDHLSYIVKVKSYNMYLPSKFVRTNGLLNKEEMILENNDGRSWTMDIRHCRNYSYISRAWKEFCAANDLKKGTRIKLELVSNGGIPVVKFYR